MIVDAHLHLCPTIGPTMEGRHRTALEYGRVRMGGRITQMLPPSFEQTRSTPEMALAHMEWAGVDKAFAMQGDYYGACNAYVAKAAARHPDQFLGFAMVDPREGEAGARRLSYLVRQRGLRGLKVETPGLGGLDLAGEKEWAVWRACAGLGIPVMFHLRPEEAERAALERVLEEVEGFTAVIAHLGLAPQEGWLERVRLAKRPTVWTEISALPALAGGPYPYREAQQVLWQAVDEVGAAKILWGSDYPSTLVSATYPQLLNWVREECGFLGDPEREAILGGNAAQFFERARALRFAGPGEVAE